MLSLKTILYSLGNYITTKLQTKEGRLALIIVASIITGGSLINSYNVVDKNRELAGGYKELKKENKRIDSLYDAKLQTADADCNKKIKEGALLHQQLQNIYSNKTQENLEIVKEQKEIIKEKTKVLDTQEKNIQQLSNSLKKAL